MEKEKFIELLKEHKFILYKVINSYCKNPEDRKDLEQEIVIQLWRSIGTYDDQFKLSTWIYRLAMNVAISFYRTNSTRTSKTNYLNDFIFEYNLVPEKPEDISEELKLLHSFIGQLDDLSKQIIILYLEDCSYSEISQIVGISTSNVGTKINRIKKTLKQKFYQLKTTEYGN